MAVRYIEISGSTAQNIRLRSSLSHLEVGIRELKETVDAIAFMVDGDTAVAANYTLVTDKFGFLSNAEAKKAFDELNTLLNKLQSVGDTSNVKGTLDQVFAEFR